MRQGQLKKLQGQILTLVFPSLFEEHRCFLLAEEVLLELETMLSEDFEAPLKLELVAADAQRQDDDAAEGMVDEDGLNMHARDKSAIVVQKVFGVKIRTVFQESKQVSYHLGMSSNDHFKE